MSTFYILPSRSLLGQRFAEFLQNVFPGRIWSREEWRDLAELLGGDTFRHADTFVIYREDMPEGVALNETLRHDFGAGAGDEAVEIALGGRLGILTTRRWRIEDGPRQAA
jgi:hypothetical protein